MKKSYLFLSIAITILIITIIAVNQRNLTLSPNSSSTCTELDYNDENAINILYISDKETAEKYSNYFFSNSPFSENKNAFNVYVLENYNPECEIYKGIALLCYSRDLIRESSKCPNDYIIVPKEEPESIRSSSYDRVISINTLHEMPVLIHEFGHSFASLAEEYVPSTLPLSSPNCKNSCEQFQDNCFEGCSKSDYKRSIENGVMRTLSSNDYGEFNKNLIINLIAQRKSIITGSAISNARSCNHPMYLVELTPSEDSLTISSITLTEGCISNQNGDYSYQTETSSGEIISQGSFSREIYTDAPKENLELEGETFTSDQPIYLTIPATSEDNSITIQNENQEIITSRNLDRVGATPCPI
ncbi:MAG: hypothetical protein AABW79_02510 [Nanoarchaeota archaeon]